MQSTLVSICTRHSASLAVLGMIIFFLLRPVCADEVEAAKEQLESMSLVELETMSDSIDQRLKSIAQYNLRSGLGAIGYRSEPYDDPDHREWFEIKFESELSIDEIVLVPCVLRNEKANFIGDAFPTEIRVTLGTGKGHTRTKVTEINVTNNSPFRVAPLIIPTNQLIASWVRIEVDQLPQRKYDNRHVFQFSEVLVFSNQRNVALHQPVEASSNNPQGSPAWESKYAVDGFVPYLLNSAIGNGTRPFLSKVGIGDEPSITIDLEVVTPVSRINLHLVDQADTVPQSFAGDFGIPKKLKIEGALTEDFSDAKLLNESSYQDVYDCAPIVMLQFGSQTCRYIRLTALDPFIYDAAGQYGTRIGFAEIEAFEDEENVALGKPAAANFALGSGLSLLTDGKNRYGQILPIRSWLSELSERHFLEERQPLVSAELTRRYQKQRQNLKLLIGLATVLALMAIVIAFAGSLLRQRAIRKTREEIAADLHDEIGANIHAIGLISDMAKVSQADPNRLDQLLQRMRELTQRTGKAASFSANLLESQGLFDDLVADMRRASARITADFEHRFNVDGEENLDLNPKRRIGLFLFYKECLTNILRHSNASHLTTDLIIKTDRISLEVTDDGAGLPESTPGKPVPTSAIPKSLRRRARLLGGKLTAQHLDPNGTKIKLVLR